MNIFGLRGIDRMYELRDNLLYYLKRRFQYSLLKLGYLLRAEIEVTLPLGFKIWLTPREAIQKMIFLNGNYEYTTTRFLQSYLAKDMIFFDIGANIGYFTLLAAKHIGNKGIVYSFEPEISVYKKLRNNITLNAFKNVFLNNAAISDKVGKVDFFIPEQVKYSVNSGLSSLKKQVHFKNSQKKTVKSYSLDFYCKKKNIKKINVCKIDTEGAEMLVLKGAEKYLKKKAIDIFVIEYPEELSKKFGYKAAEIINYLKQFGYDVASPVYINGVIKLSQGIDRQSLRNWEPFNIIVYSPLVKNNLIFER